MTGDRTRLPALGPRGEGWFLIQLALMWLVIALGVPPRWAPADALDWLRIGGGVALVLFGLLGLAYRGGRALAGNITALPMPPEGGRLVEHGIYARIRHPIYAGVVVAGLGWALLAGSWTSLLADVALTLFVDLKSRREEAWLSERFPGYAAYRQRTRRFIPGIY